MAKRNRKQQKTVESSPATEPEKSLAAQVSTAKPTQGTSNEAQPSVEASIAKPRRSWRDFFRAVRERVLVEALRLFLFSPLIILLSPIVYVPCYRASLKEAVLTVDHRERVTKGSGDSQQSYFLVWSAEGEVFCVTDTWSFMSFDAADRYGKLHEGTRIRANVAGWRIPFFSWYRNIVEIKSVEPSSAPATTVAP